MARHSSAKKKQPNAADVARVARKKFVRKTPVYDQSLRDDCVALMLRKDGPSANVLAEEIGISQPTLSRWLREDKRRKHRQANKNVVALTQTSVGPARVEVPAPAPAQALAPTPAPLALPPITGEGKAQVMDLLSHVLPLGQQLGDGNIILLAPIVISKDALTTPVNEKVQPDKIEF